MEDVIFVDDIHESELCKDVDPTDEIEGSNVPLDEMESSDVPSDKTAASSTNLQHDESASTGAGDTSSSMQSILAVSRYHS